MTKPPAQESPCDPCDRWYLRPRGISFTIGLCLAWATMVLLQGWLAAFGELLSAGTAAAWAAAMGSLLALRLSRNAFRETAGWAWWLAAAALCGAFPTLIDLSPAPLRWFSAEAFSARTVQFLALFPGACLVWGLPVFATTLALARTAGGLSPTTLLAGGASGFIIGLAVVVPFADLTVCLELAGFGLAGCAVWSAVRKRLLRGGSAIASPQPTSPSPPGLDAASAFAIVCFAALLPAVTRLTSQWALPSVWLIHGRFALFLIGATSAAVLVRWKRLRPLAARMGPSFWPLLTLSICVSVTFFSEVWMQAAFAVNTSVPYVWLMQIARALITGAVWIGLGGTVSWTAVTYRLPAAGTNRRIPASPVVCGTIAAWSLSGVLLAAGTPAGMILTVGASGAAAAIAWSVRRSSGDAVRRPWVQWSLCGGLAAAGISGLFPTGFESARIMFSPLAVQYSRQGSDWDDLAAIDDGRPVGCWETEFGTLTEWSYRGLQTVFKRNGITRGSVSRDERVMPQAPVDVLLASLPVALHDRPRDVCFLGWGSGVAPATSLDFPLEHIVCVEKDALLASLTFPEGRGYGSGTIDPFHDDRFKLIAVPPALAVYSLGRTFDVVISNPEPSLLSGSVSEYTAEFYRAAARRLNPGGIFCQRFQHYDLGPDAFVDLSVTMKAAFPSLIAIAISPGETLFVGRTGSDGVPLGGLPERLQADYQRRVLARSGLDWGHVVKVPMLPGSALEEIAASQTVAPNTIADDREAFSHAADAARWGNKWQEKLERVSVLQRRLADQAGEAGQNADVRRRIEETKSQQYVMGELTDRPWSYRAVIKRELQTKPRSHIVQVKGERPHHEMHPVDERRVEYLEALAAAYKSSPPSAEKIHALTKFVAPYDPLLSFFVHHEAAELYSRNPELDPKAEYLHRLHTVYFSDVRDRSIRNIVAALDLIALHPAVAGSPAERFDQMNGLMQMLFQRWQLRRGKSPDSADIAMNDITNSISTAERALAVMDEIRSEAEYDAGLWVRRQEFFESQLIRPLRTYRGQILPHQHSELSEAMEARRKREAAEANAEQAEPTAETEPPATGR